MQVTEQPPPPARASKLPILIGAGIAAIAVIVAAIVIAVVMSRRSAEPAAVNATASPTSALSIETQVECTGIRREYAAWNRDMPRLVTMVTTSNPRDVVRHELDGLKEDGDALLKAVSGYSDQPSKVLAAAVATYNADLSFVRLEHQLKDGKFTEESKQEAVHSAGAVQTAYKAFMQQTCGEAS